MRNQKTSSLLLFLTAVLHFGILEGMDSIEGNCNDVITLPCKATDRTNKYRYVVWYKITTERDKTAIVKKKNDAITHYNNFTFASLGENESLQLAGVTPSDSGVYDCYLAADIGGRNKESTIRLNISECVYLNTSHPTTMVTTEPCPVVSEFAVSWALIGFFLISLAKITLCIITVKVCDVIFKRIQKRNQDRRRSRWKN